MSVSFDKKCMKLGIFSLYYIRNNFHYMFQKGFKRIQKVSDSWKMSFLFSYILRSKAANIPCFQYLGLGHVRCTWEPQLRKITLQAVPMYPHLQSGCIRSYSGQHFPTFGLNTEGYGLSLRIWSECGKMLTRITPNTGTFHAVY